MEEVYFEFPTAAAREEIIARYNAEKNRVKSKMKRKTLTLTIVFMVFICFAFVSTIVSTIGVIALFILMLSLRRDPQGTSLTEIYATYDSMTLTVHSLLSDTKKYTIPYDAIIAATIDDKYSYVSLAVNSAACTIENLSHKSNAKNTNSLIEFKLNSYSAEQGFFVFYAPKMIPNYNIDRVDAARIFGNEEKYFSQI